jgi:hypothetical protein
MHRRLFCLGWLLLSCLMSGCSERNWLQKFIPEADDKLARQFIDAVIHEQSSEAVALLAPKIQGPASRKGIEQLIMLFRAGAIESIEVIGAYRQAGLAAGKTTLSVQLTYQLHLSTGWFAGTVVVVDSESGRRIISARFDPIADSLERQNRLALAGKSYAHYAFLFLAVLIPTFCIATLVICARSKIRRKWAWIMFIVVGFATIRLNWTTGEIASQVLSFQLFGASALRPSMYAPWIIGISVPIGAIVFLFKRKELIAKAAQIAPSLPTPPDPPIQNAQSP